jgi:hypothetical protein
MGSGWQDPVCGIEKTVVPHTAGAIGIDVFLAGIKNTGVL